MLDIKNPDKEFKEEAEVKEEAIKEEAIAEVKEEAPPLPPVPVPFFENIHPHVKKFSSQHIWGEVPGDKLIVHWDEFIHSQVNYLDEDLFLQLTDPSGENMTEYRINYLAEKEIDIKPERDYLIRLVVKEKFRVGVASTSDFTPSITFITESIMRYMITWSELEWDYIRRDVEREHRVNWDWDTEVVLKIFRNPGSQSDPQEEWKFPGTNDMEVVGGDIRYMTLAVVRKEGDKKELKEIFRVWLEPGQVKRVMDQLKVETPRVRPFFQLSRAVYETDAIHLKASWDVPPEKWTFLDEELKKRGTHIGELDIVLRLFFVGKDGAEEVSPYFYKKVMGQGDWFFPNAPTGALYRAILSLEEKNRESGKTPPISQLMVSENFYVPSAHNQITLLPVDEDRIYSYWHLNLDEVWDTMWEIHNAEAHRIRFFIRVFHDFAGNLYHHQHLDREISPYQHNNYYLKVEPDKIYRVQLVAVADGWKVQPVTPISNPVQTMRSIRGNNWVNHINHYQPQDHPTFRAINSRMNTSYFSQGYMVLHLHAHLPFVAKRINYGTSGYWRPSGYMEEWYHEAVRETYIPLIRIFEQLMEEGVDFKISMDISPTLCSMMRNPVLQEEFLNYIDSMIALAKTEKERISRYEPWYNQAVRMHLDHFRRAKSTFLRYNRDLTRAFKMLQDMGKLEISTCGATHGFFPLIGSRYYQAIEAQVKTAVLDYENTFGRRPYGIWLPECAYTPGVEQILQKYGLRYFFSETHTILRGDAYVDFGVHAPVYIRGSEISVFARDPETGEQVWSGEVGYPGDPDYLEFHIRGGPLKYNRITNRKGGRKQPYIPVWAEQKAAMHAEDFMRNRNFRFDHIKNWFWKKPLVVATYDAELFGHHWFEGPRFLYYLLKKMYYDQNQTELTTPSHYLAIHNYNQEIFPTPSSWGAGGTFDKWMMGSVSWMYRHMNDACSEMINLTRWGIEKGLKNAHKDNPGVRILSQMARELLLSQNSDAAFNITNGHFIDRMKELFFENLNNFWTLANMFKTFIETGNYNEIILRKMERLSNLFPVIDPFVYGE